MYSSATTSPIEVLNVAVGFALMVAIAREANRCGAAAISGERIICGASSAARALRLHAARAATRTMMSAR
eukprot:4253157-Pleurochrysis_carterae.AAC.2